MTGLTGEKRTTYLIESDPALHYEEIQCFEQEGEALGRFETAEEDRQEERVEVVPVVGIRLADPFVELWTEPRDQSLSHEHQFIDIFEISLEIFLHFLVHDKGQNLGAEIPISGHLEQEGPDVVESLMIIQFRIQVRHVT